MATEITSDPEYPVVDEVVTLSVTDGDGDSYAFELASVPELSELETDIIGETLSGTDPEDTFTPDVAGVYGFTAYGYTKFPGDKTPTLIETVTGTISVGTLLEFPIGTVGGHGGTLQVRAHGSTVRAAEFTTFTTELARIAALNEDVRTALAALEGVAVSALGPDLVSATRTLRTKFEAHRVHSASHVDPDVAGPDNSNVVNTQAPYTLATAIATLNELRDRLSTHLVEGPLLRESGLYWHTSDDTENAICTPPTTDLATAIVTYSDLAYRVYNRHRVLGSGHTPAVHFNAGGDTTNTLASATVLSALIVAYLDALVDQGATAPDGENQGAIDALSKYGFKHA